MAPTPPATTSQPHAAGAQGGHGLGDQHFGDGFLEFGGKIGAAGVIQLVIAHGNQHRVLRPEKLKSKSPLRSIGRGSLKRPG